MSELTPEKLFDALTDLQNKNAGLIADVRDAVNALKVTESKLDSARALYEKHWSCLLKENLGKICLTAIAIIAIIVAGTVSVLKKANTKASSGNSQVEILNNQNQQ